MSSLRFGVLVVSSVFLVVVLSAAARAGNRKELIEFGWDEPDPAFMRAHSAAMDSTPFDGCVFHINATMPDGKQSNFTWQGWSHQVFTAAELQPALDDLKAARFRHLKSNFLRFNTAPGDVDWFDDFSAIKNNARLAAQVARAGGCPGILFDIEQYEHPLFDYAKQRDAETKSWDEYAAQVRQRGREVMTAFQSGYPGLTVFLTYGYGLSLAQTQNGKAPLSHCSYGLLAPFLDGMVEAARRPGQIVDGYESAYGYKNAAQFQKAYETIRKGVLPLVADPGRYQKIVSVGFGIWMDFDWRRLGWDADRPEKNYFTPEALKVSARAALRRADRYVWVYSETPRWWSDDGPVKLPAEYGAGLENAKRQS